MDSSCGDSFAPCMLSAHSCLPVALLHKHAQLSPAKLGPTRPSALSSRRSTTGPKPSRVARRPRPRARDGFRHCWPPAVALPCPGTESRDGRATRTSRGTAT
eukprot:366522-Chlamydomonas_euryale.AAC.8